MADPLSHLISIQKDYPKNVILLEWYDDKLFVCPVVPCVKDRLTVIKKDLVNNQLQKTECELFVLAEDTATPVLITYPGFLGTIQRTLLLHGFLYKTIDRRIATLERGFPQPRLDLMGGFRFSQRELISKALIQNKSGLIGAPTRYGKSLLFDTEILMYDYSIKKVQDIVVGDLLMGPDGLPRKVTALGRGREKAYRVNCTRGEDFSCNESHILHLMFHGSQRRDGFANGDKINITVKDYLKLPVGVRVRLYMMYAPLDLSEKQLPLDPWLAGAYLCRGRRTSICVSSDTPKNAVFREAGNCLYTMKRYTDSKGRQHRSIIVKGKSHKNPFAKFCDVVAQKGKGRIPDLYLSCSKQQRMELLAGIIDTRGSFIGSYQENYMITTSNIGFAKDFVRLCRSLGFSITRNYTKRYGKKGRPISCCCIVSGDFSKLNLRSGKAQRKVPRTNPTTTGFIVEDIGEQDYYGFELEGPDKLFLLWDHLVTHNTILIVNTLRAFPGLTTVVTAPGVDLVKQLYADITGPRGIRNREVRCICSGKGRTPAGTGGITVCSADSLDKCDVAGTELLLADEPHALVTDSRIAMLNAFTRARRYGYGATLHGRFDGMDPLIVGAFGDVLAERTYKEAVAEGAICPIHILFLKVELPPKRYSTRHLAYKYCLFHNGIMADVVRHICTEIIPQDFQTMIFIKDEPQADLYKEVLGEGTIAMAKRLTAKEREEVDRLMKENIVKRCLCTKIYVQGVTFSDVRVLINAEGGGNNTSAIQKPGRLAEIRPGKKCGIVIDFLFVPNSASKSSATSCLSGDSFARRRAYKDKGYDITVVDSITQLKEKFLTLI